MTDVEKRGPEWGDTDGSGSDTNSGMSSAFTDMTRKTLTNKLTSCYPFICIASIIVNTNSKTNNANPPEKTSAATS